MNGHRVERYGPWLAAAAVGLAFILFGLAGLYTFRQQEHVDSRLCESTVRNRDAIRDAFNAARMVALRDSDRPDRVNAFFDAILEPIPPLECVDNQPVPKEG